jgi:arylsulfatase A-like enzyme
MALFGNRDFLGILPVVNATTSVPKMQSQETQGMMPIPFRKAKLVLMAAVLALNMACRDKSETTLPSGPNLVLISIDTLRADRLGCYGHASDTSPNIDRFARDSILFMNAYSTAPKTAESHMSMFTSLYPSVHGVATIGHDVREEIDAGRARVLSQSITTLPQILRDNGYTTVGIHGGGFLDPTFGFGRGFDTYVNSDSKTAVEWLKKHGSTTKFFLFFHTYHVHAPYTPLPPYDALFSTDYNGAIVHDHDKLKAEARATGRNPTQVFFDLVDKSDPRDLLHLQTLYDGQIAEMDRDMGVLFEAIDRYAPNTIVAFVSDHGEEFGEHNSGLGHNQLYNETLHVPLIIKQPGAAGRVIEQRVSLIDLAPTLIRMLALPPVEQFQGRLLPVLKGNPSTEKLFAEFPSVNCFSLVMGDKKLMRLYGSYEYYDLHSDEKELLNLGREGHPGSQFRELETALQEMMKNNADLGTALNETPMEDLLKESTIEQLKALGYIK